MKRDYYQILGVRPDASQAEIKRAYRKLAKRFHPDVSRDDPRKKQIFQEISEAYAVLSDPEARRQYNYLGHEGFRRSYGSRGFRHHRHTAGSYAGNHSHGPGGHSHKEGEHCGHGEDGHCGTCGHSHGEDGHCGACEEGRRTPSREEEVPEGSVRLSLYLQYGETLSSVRKEVVYEQRIPCPDCQNQTENLCPDCGGTGQKPVFENVWGEVRETFLYCSRCRGTGRIPAPRCPRCHGTGFITRTWRIPVRLPAGTYENQFFVLREVMDDPALEEEMEKAGAFRRLLILMIFLREQPGYERRGYHLYTQLEVDYPNLVLGGTLKIPTLEGDVPWTLPPGSDYRRRLRLPGKGLHRPAKIGGRGDLYVNLQVRIPRKLTPRQQELLEELRRSLGQGEGSPASAKA